MTIRSMGKRKKSIDDDYNATNLQLSLIVKRDSRIHKTQKCYILKKLSKLRLKYEFLSRNAYCFQCNVINHTFFYFIVDETGYISVSRKKIHLLVCDGSESVIEL
jgi:hypothetical protein